MNVKRFFCLLCICVALLPSGIGAREYQSVNQPGIQIPLPKRPAPAPPKPAPAKQAPAKPAQPARPKQVKIPTFEKKEPVEATPVEPAPVEVVPAQPVQAEPQPAAKIPASNGVRLFGTVEFKRPLNTLPGWLDVLARNSKEPVFQPDKRLLKGEKWQQLKSQAQDLPILEKLRMVNRFWNQSPYREDMENWGKEDYWAVPAQFIKKSGDCEDYAIAKYFTLKELGIDPQAMRIVVLRDTIRNLPHAVLAVYVDGDAYILDNVTNIVLSHKRIRNYQPQFSVNESGRWSHIRGKAAR